MMLIRPSMSHFPHPIHPAPFSPPSLFCTGVVVEVGVAGSSTWCARLQLQNTSHPVGYAVAAGSVYTLCVRGMSNVIRADFPHMQASNSYSYSNSNSGWLPQPHPKFSEFTLSLPSATITQFIPNYTQHFCLNA